jgi:RNA polymerase sigma-70 factor, ECF subfamily
MNPVGNLKEKILYIKISKKDKQAFIKAYDMYIDDIYRFVFFKVGNEDETKDITSSVFLKTWDHIQNNNLKDYKTLKSLFYKVARNLVIDHYRKKSTRQNDVELDRSAGLKDCLPDARQDAARQMEIKNDTELVRMKMTELKDEYQEAITLRYINELSIEEMAGIMNKSKGNIRVLVYRSMNALRELLSQEKEFSGQIQMIKKDERKKPVKTIK